jgi:hypothetical protein
MYVHSYRVYEMSDDGHESLPVPPALAGRVSAA